MAARAASFTSAGAGKSGKPCARLTALYSRARRFISRITDSVNFSALVEIMLRAACASFSAVGRASAELVIGVRPRFRSHWDWNYFNSAKTRGPLPAAIGGRLRCGGLCAAVNVAVKLGIARDDLDVVPGLVERNGFD